MTKSDTDRHWNERAVTECDDAKVNIADTVQRDLELEFIFALADQWPSCRSGLRQRLRN